MSVYWQNGPSGLDDLSGTAGTPAAASDPAAYYTAHNDTHQIVYRAANGHLYELYWVGVHTVVGWDLTAATGAPPAVGNPSAYYVGAENTKHVIYRSSDGRLHEIWWYPGQTPGYGDLTSVRRGAARRGQPRGVHRERASARRVSRNRQPHLRDSLVGPSHEGDGHVEGTHVTRGGHRNALRRQQVTGGDGSTAGDVDVALQRKLLAGIRFRR